MGASASQVQQRYFLQKVKLGQGSFGTVWRAVDRKTDTTVAVKQLDKSKFAFRGVQRADVDQEIATMKALHHENITRLHDTYEDKQFIYLALEYCDGGDFGDKLKERGLSTQEGGVCSWMRQICAAIQCMHSKRICHRDVKPDNFMISGEGTLKLSDFGLAVYLPRGQLLTEKCGTPAFMSPEQHSLPQHGQGYGIAVDMWAAGLCMYMILLGGQHPFITDSRQIDNARLMRGALDFKSRQSFLGVDISGAVSSTRGSDAARELCRSMVQPDFRKRIGAAHALRTPFLSPPRVMGIKEEAGYSPPLTAPFTAAVRDLSTDMPLGGTPTRQAAQTRPRREMLSDDALKDTARKLAEAADSRAIIARDHAKHVSKRLAGGLAVLSAAGKPN